MLRYAFVLPATQLLAPDCNNTLRPSQQVNMLVRPCTPSFMVSTAVAATMEGCDLGKQSTPTHKPWHGMAEAATALLPNLVVTDSLTSANNRATNDSNTKVIDNPHSSNDHHHPSPDLCVSTKVDMPSK